MPVEIDDPRDRRVELYHNLPDAVLRRATDHRNGVFVAEGARTVRQLVASRFPVRSILLRPERVAALADLVRSVEDQGVPVYVAGQAVFDQIAGFPVHRGVLALGERQPDLEISALLAAAGLIVVVEGVNDHENLGAIFRNAAAFGAGAVVLDPTCCDPLYRRSIRVSAGQVLNVPFARLVPWPDAVAALSGAGFEVVALDPGASETLEALRPCRPLALLVGAEATGLTDAARAAATSRVRIPMAAGVDSLNVATSLAIALYRLTPAGAPGQAGV